MTHNTQGMIGWPDEHFSHIVGIVQNQPDQPVYGLKCLKIYNSDVLIMHIYIYTCINR